MSTATEVIKSVEKLPHYQLQIVLTYMSIKKQIEKKLKTLEITTSAESVADVQKVLEEVRQEALADGDVKEIKILNNIEISKTNTLQFAFEMEFHGLDKPITIDIAVYPSDDSIAISQTAQ